MKLIFALYKYFPFGGLQKDMLTIAKEAVDRGHEVKIFCRDWQGERPNHLEINVLPVSAFSNHNKNRQFIYKLFLALENTQYDSLVGFDKIPNVDIYYAADTCFKTKLYRQRPRFYRLLPRYCRFIEIEKTIFSPQAKTQILALARPTVEEYIEAYNTPERRFHILPPGISKDRINTTQAKASYLHKELGIDSRAKILLFVGSGFKTKGLDRAIRCLPVVNNGRPVHLVVAGQDKAAPFQALSAKLDVEDKVHFLGGRNDVPDLLKSADLLVHPARRENTGTVLLEAVVSCLPVVCTAACGYSHYIEDNELGCVIAEPFAQKQLNTVLARALENKQQIEVWRDNGQRFAQSADIYSLPQRALDIIEALNNQ